MEKCHFIGIGGIGMSGLAKILLGQNKQVSGSDISSSYVTEELTKAGAHVFIGHSSQYVTADATVIYGTDIKQDNPEYQAALSLKCPLMHRSELLQKLMEPRRSLAVAGTHGKTTTSALLTWVLSQCSLNPSFAVGGIIRELNANACHGSGDYFVAEACESDGTFLKYSPYGAIVTNIDNDHMDFYRDEQALIAAFSEFMSKVSSHPHLFWCGDDARLVQLKPPGISYGLGSNCQLRASNFRQYRWEISFDVFFQGKKYSQLIVPLTGQHNALNALAVFGMAISLGIDEQAVRSALQSFKGVGRRCEKKGEVRGVLVIDDYGHHPTEIKAVLQATRSAIKERRLVVAYQPHRYSRAKECMGRYEGCFDEADALFMTEIYSAGEFPIPGVTHEQIMSEIPNCVHVPHSEIVKTLAKFLRPHDVLVTLGAGDITKVGPEVLKQTIQKLKVAIIYGGSSVEHDISLKSGEHIYQSLNQELYETTLLKISRTGQWDKEDALREIQDCDIIFPVLHGTNGEDGTIQGMFEMMGKAYVGCNVRASAITMDKVLTKRLAAERGIRSSPYVAFSRYQWKQNSLDIEGKINSTLKYPLYVKPIHLGSSIGVQKVVSSEGLRKAIMEAFRFDTHVLAENGIVGRELEFAVIGGDEMTIFPPGEVCSHVCAYDYHNKYSKEGTPLIPKAEVTAKEAEDGIQFAKMAYEAAGCDAWARVDTFLDGEGNYWLNEINPIPGCTQFSLYPQMCAANGLSSSELVDRLIILGLHRKRQQDGLEKTP